MRFYFGTNLKMNHAVAETVRFVTKVQARLPTLLPPEIAATLWIAPSYTALAAAAQAASDARIWIGGQNVFWEESGAYTGEISPRQLVGCGAAFVMLGHAERRALFGETDEALARKVAACTRLRLPVMLCVGESAEAKAAGQGRAFVGRQLDTALADFPWVSSMAEPARPGLIVLYEPVWSIGAGGQAADPGYVAEAMGGIRERLRALNDIGGSAVPILYGGSVTANNVRDYTRLPGCQGVGVGRAAWTPEDFITVLKRCL